MEVIYRPGIYPFSSVPDFLLEKFQEQMKKDNNDNSETYYPI